MDKYNLEVINCVNILVFFKMHRKFPRAETPLGKSPTCVLLYFAILTLT